jgi:type VI secretion system secreted protein Hcp
VGFLQVTGRRRRVVPGSLQPALVSRVNRRRGGAVEDYFLKIDGISGESLDDKHKNEIELVSFSWGTSRDTGHEGAGAGAGAGRARFQDFHFTMRVNKASPQLFLATVSGKHIKEASLSVRRASKAQLEYLKIKLTDVLVTSFEEAGGGDVPEEMVGLAFGRIELEYKPQQATGALGGAVKAGWNLAKNAKI